MAEKNDISGRMPINAKMADISGHLAIEAAEKMVAAARIVSETQAPDKDQAVVLAATIFATVGIILDALKPEDRMHFVRAFESVAAEQFTIWNYANA